MKKIKQLLPYVLIIGILVLAFTSFQSFTANANSGVLETQETREIMKAMDKAYAAISYANKTNDPSHLADALVDTQDYKAPPMAKENVEKVFGSKAAENPGYLTTMQAKFILSGKADAKMQALLEKAKSENRKVTKEELKEVMNENNGQLPPNGMYYNSTGKTKLTYDKVEINGDRATVYYDTGAAYQKAILVKIDNNWLVASIEHLRIHY